MRYISELFKGDLEKKEDLFICNKGKGLLGRKAVVNILAMGDVGSTLLLGMKLLGGREVSEIGIFDISSEVMSRFEAEMNQISWGFDDDTSELPKVKLVDEKNLFNCDVFVFCASKGVPKVGDEAKDVRMIQYEANSQLIKVYGEKAVKEGFEGIFAVVSDPVDPLCKTVLKSGLKREQIRGFGLGVMNGRAKYYAKQDENLKVFLKEGRVFGPHGSDLVVADSIKNYNHENSLCITKQTVEANIKIREMGFKPYFAPAVASGAMSILAMLKGKWHYSSICFGDAFLGTKNRMTKEGTEVENPPLDHLLFERINKALVNLERIK